MACTLFKVGALWGRCSAGRRVVAQRLREAAPPSWFFAGLTCCFLTLFTKAPFSQGRCPAPSLSPPDQYWPAILCLPHEGWLGLNVPT